MTGGSSSQVTNVRELGLSAAQHCQNVGALPGGGGV